MLKDISIQNYRLFKQFSVTGFNRINLLVGANNSGKTSLMEALYLLTTYQDPSTLLRVLEKRKEFVEDKENMINLYLVEQIFNGYKLTTTSKIVLCSHQDLPIVISYRFKDEIEAHIINSSSPDKGILFEVDASTDKKKGGFIIYDYWDSDEKNLIDGYSGDIIRQPNHQFLAINQLNYKIISKMWNEIVLTPAEEVVLEALRILEPDLERIALLNYTTPQMGIRLKVKRQPKPIPLASMGDGMYHIFALILTLVKCRGGVFLVDEIDTGLHYKALTKMWQLLIETAQKLDVQLFATTHSWDCLVALHQALTDTQATDLGTVFRLEQQVDTIKATTYNGEELKVAIEHDIEVR